jgi:lauroyl/myristoyl acyltransferase
MTLAVRGRSSILKNVSHHGQRVSSMTSIGHATSAASPAASPSVACVRPQHTLPLVTFNDLLWLLYLYPVRWLARVVPRSFLYAIGRLADPIVQFHLRKNKVKAACWIAQACRVTPERSRTIARRSISNNLVRTLDELVLVRTSSTAMLRCHGVDGMRRLESALAHGNGVILLVGHFNANRVAVRYLAAQGCAALSVHNQRPGNATQGRLGSQFSQPRYIALQKEAIPDQVYIQDPACSLKILQRLRAGGLAVIQMDGRAGTNPIEHPFLGVPSRVPSGIFEIVRLSGCAVVPMLCLGRSDGFRIRFDPELDIQPSSSRGAFASANLPRFMAAIERHVIENPEQWRLWNK